MKIVYQTHDKVTMKEKADQDDIIFYLTVEDEELKKGYYKVRAFFESDRILTDALFYTHGDNQYEAIVRADYYCEFLLACFKNQLIVEMKWE